MPQGGGGSAGSRAAGQGPGGAGQRHTSSSDGAAEAKSALALLSVEQGTVRLGASVTVGPWLSSPAGWLMLDSSCSSCSDALEPSIVTGDLVTSRVGRELPSVTLPPFVRVLVTDPRRAPSPGTCRQVPAVVDSP